MSIQVKPIWKYSYSKLSDILVPLSIVEKQVRAIEGIDNFSFEIKIKNEKKNLTKDELYAIPYPFIRSIREDYGSVNEEILVFTDEMKAALHNRMLRYYNFVLTKDELDEIDNDPNLCSILNIYNGLVSTFDRTEVRELVPITIPYELPTMLAKLWNIHEGETSGGYMSMAGGVFVDMDEDDEEDDIDEEDMVSDYVNHLRRMTIGYHMNGEKYMIVYQLVRTNKQPDRKLYRGNSSDNCIWASGTSDLLHDASECMSINKNTLSLYKQKSKVILVK